MPRLLWEGVIRIGSIDAPVALYPASRQDAIAFDWLDRHTLTPICHKQVSRHTGCELGNSDIVRGYEYEERHYVILSDEEISSVHVHANHAVDIFAFVDAQEVPLPYFETPYYLMPSPGGEKTYALLRASLLRAKKIGLAYVMLQERQHLAALIPHGPALVLNTLRWASEVRPTEGLNVPMQDFQAHDLSEQDVSEATRLIESMTRRWDVSQYHDTHRTQMMALIKRKIQEGKTTQLTAPDNIAVSCEQPIAESELIEFLRRNRYPRFNSTARRNRRMHLPSRAAEARNRSSRT